MRILWSDGRMLTVCFSFGVLPACTDSLCSICSRTSSHTGRCPRWCRVGRNNFPSGWEHEFQCNSIILLMARFWGLKLKHVSEFTSKSVIVNWTWWPTGTSMYLKRYFSFLHISDWNIQFVFTNVGQVWSGENYIFSHFWKKYNVCFHHCWSTLLP